MKIYNKEKTQIIENPDLTLGKLEKDFILKKEKNIGYFEKILFDENGNIIGSEPDIEKNSKKYEEIKEEIQVYIPYTTEELQIIENNKQIVEAKEFLTKTDYIVTKIAERKMLGQDVTAELEEYKITLEKREEAREIINFAEANISKLNLIKK